MRDAPKPKYMESDAWWVGYSQGRMSYALWLIRENRAEDAADVLTVSVQQIDEHYESQAKAAHGGIPDGS